jgi:hypothetical protein
LFGGKASADATSPSRTAEWCLTPALSKVFEDLAARGALQRVLHDQFTLERIDVRQNQIELEIKDEARQPYAITLTLLEVNNAKPDGRGRHFLFYLGTPAARPNPQARTALLAAAAVVDEAILENVLQLCAGADQAAQVEPQRETGFEPATRQGPQGQPPVEYGYPLGMALASAAAQVMVLVTATVFGLRTLRWPNAPVDTNSPQDSGGHPTR